MQIINKNYLLHQAVIHQNKDLVDYFMNIGAEVNLEDEDDCSPMFYALKKGDKCLIQTLARSRGRVICPLDEII